MLIGNRYLQMYVSNETFKNEFDEYGIFLKKENIEEARNVLCQSFKIDKNNGTIKLTPQNIARIKEIFEVFSKRYSFEKIPRENVLKNAFKLHIVSTIFDSNAFGMEEGLRLLALISLSYNQSLVTDNSFGFYSTVSIPNGNNFVRVNTGQLRRLQAFNQAGFVSLSIKETVFNEFLERFFPPMVARFPQIEEKFLKLKEISFL